MLKIDWTLHRFECLASTNDTAREMAAAGAPQGVVVVAGAQTAGRGQHGRSWASPAGQGLYLSAILRPAVKPDALAFITLAAAVAVAETIAAEFGVNPDIKWPNDVMLSGKKVCGILVESAIEGGTVRYGIVGIGLNVDQLEFPEEIADTATSLRIETGRQGAPQEVLPLILDHLEKWYGVALSSPIDVLTRWEELSTYARNCDVTVTLPDGIIEGVTAGLTDRGTLTIRTADGKTREVFSGEVTLRKR